MDLVNKSSSSFFKTERDILSELLADKRSENTKRAYEKDLRDFFMSATGVALTPELIGEFLSLERFRAIALVLEYKSQLINKGLKEATVNRRLASIKSLCRYAQKIGKCSWSLEEVQGEKTVSYRDTSGVTVDVFKKILEVIDVTTLSGKRDRAIFHLLWSNALRRGEIAKCRIYDFDESRNMLKILGKGRGTQKEIINLSPTTTFVICQWLTAAREGDRCLSENDPLFVRLNEIGSKPLSAQSIYVMVRNTSLKSGLTKPMSPHRCRHSAITEALNSTGGDLRKVQKLSRHKKIETLLIYDDNRGLGQGEVSAILSDLLD